MKWFQAETGKVATQVKEVVSRMKTWSNIKSSRNEPREQEKAIKKTKTGKKKKKKTQTVPAFSLNISYLLWPGLSIR